MPELMLLESGRGRRRRGARGLKRDSRGRFLSRRSRVRARARRRNPVAIANPRRRSYRRRGYARRKRYYARRASRRVTMRGMMSSNWAMDVATAAVGMIGTQKVSEMFKQSGWADVLVTAAVAGVAGMMLSKADAKAGRQIALGGGIAAALKAVAQFPQLKELASPGSIVVGRPVPARGMVPMRRLAGAALPPVRRL